jgi:uncharacterized membrane protein (UPF0127 family)
MKKIILISIIFLLLFTLYFYIRRPLSAKAVINGHIIYLELAVTEQEKERGLGYRDSLGENAGMLFVFQHKDRYGFWMKGMQFPLDFIWIDGNKVADLSRNIPQPANNAAQPVSLAPNEPVDKILEVNAGVIDRIGVQTGDLVQFIN